MTRTRRGRQEPPDGYRPDVKPGMRPEALLAPAIGAVVTMAVMAAVALGVGLLLGWWRP